MSCLKGIILWRALALGTVAFAGWPAATARAQLISPGELSTAHRELEGVRGCTQCHELGRQGASDTKCLACHTPLRARIAAGRGTHARTKDRACASCHKEHFGRTAPIVRFDPARFDHRSAGVVLTGAHADAECRDCHNPTHVTDPAVRSFASRAGLQRTWLGVDTRCAGCHRDEDAHAEQFGRRGCEECHGVETWDTAPRFSHDEARYRLTGAHRAADCAGCHRTEAGGSGNAVVRWRPVAGERCAACHGADDPHGAGMSDQCQECHSTDDWSRMDRAGFENRFNHSATGWPLRGAHARVDCAACHTADHPQEGIRLVFAARSGGEYRRPRAARCDDCHLDAHDGAFAAGTPDCSACHGDAAWTPSRWDVAQHDAETEYRLEGAHAAVPCLGCHRDAAGEPRWSFSDTGCTACHADPHAGQFADRACEDCHDTNAFTPADFDHATTRFPLEGAHDGIACAECHPAEPGPGGAMVTRWRDVGTECADCHREAP